MQSPIYWHPLFYRKAMQWSYGKQFYSRYERLARHIPKDAEVFECCMGDALLYTKYLRQKNISYSACDVNPVFVRTARRKGVNAKLCDIQRDSIPKADYIVLHGSLYHFIPNEEEVIRKLLLSAGKMLIIAESVENMSNAKSGLRAAIGAFLSKAKTGQSKIKFTRESLRRSFEKFRPHISKWEENPGEREVIICLQP